LAICLHHILSNVCSSGPLSASSLGVVDFWLVILGGALAILGSVAAQVLQSRAARRQWELERGERQLDRAASDLAHLRVFVEEYNPSLMIGFVDPENPFREHSDRTGQWRAIRPGVTRIGLMEPAVSNDIRELVARVLDMIELTGDGIALVVQGNRPTTPPDEAWSNQNMALRLIGEIAEALNGGF